MTDITPEPIFQLASGFMAAKHLFGFTPPFGDVGRDLVYLAPLCRGNTHCYTVSAPHAGMPPPPCLPCTCRTTASCCDAAP